METKKKKSKIGKIILTVVAVVVLVFAVAGINHSCQSAESERKQAEHHKNHVGVDDFKTFEWPDSVLANMIPKPKSDFGRIDTESSDYLSVYIGKTSEKDYSDYVKNCMDSGFDVDYHKTDNDFSAKNSEGYRLSVEFDDELDEVMQIIISAPKEETEAPETEEPTQAPTEAPEEEPNEKAVVKPTEKAEVTPKSNNSSENFREAMDEYEELMNEYIDFMKKYNNSDDKIGMLNDYNKMLKQYTTAIKKLGEIDEDSLSTEDLEYYIEVTERVNKRLSEIGS